ncbi:hypothetical protein HN592_01600 [Candidatus Woesearchaeota archaeon]|jgi:hypothetical protein|nr:hypothetical protein [Candidatus Woesearchaeota archaeon]MBT4368620.1 hypothetical protein [Candidatus Woesearchaeota archaeon]MBT4713071.1 hypothetical protein [Candidatus Woesearchaeota archaeon]MBT6638993.1 hypothetical protein [Candidatus Woesearchaeota archaeon]MBT7134192.1 hypothetical protein [Candidatus Woesearchaeota archaeon]
MNKQAIMAWVVALIFISSAFGMVASNMTSSKIRYNDHVINVGEDRYFYEVDDVEVSFYSSPGSVENVVLPEDFVGVLRNTKMIYMTAELNDTLIEPISVLIFDVSKYVFDTDSVYVQPAFTTNETELPKITCEDASSSVPVVYLKKGLTRSASFVDNCLNITVASAYDVASYRDRLLYGFYGVI